MSWMNQRCRILSHFARNFGKSTRKKIEWRKGETIKNVTYNFLEHESNRVFGPVSENVRLKKRTDLENPVQISDDISQSSVQIGQPEECTTLENIHVIEESPLTNSIDNYFEEQQNHIETQKDVFKDQLEEVLNIPLFITDRSTIDSQLYKPIFSSSGVNQQLPVASVSKILERSRSPEQQSILDKWKAKMIAELGEEGFEIWQKETFARGTNLHTSIQCKLETGEDPTNLMDVNANFWESISPHFTNFGDISFVEQYCKHERLNYHGYFDCIGKFRNEICLVEWKTSKKKKSSIHSTFDYPLQVAAYMGAVLSDKRYDLQVDRGLIVVAYADGSLADIHTMERYQCEQYWLAWLYRVQRYWELTLQDMQGLQQDCDPQ